jgi:AraC-like DNA-binding protein
LSGTRLMNLSMLPLSGHQIFRTSDIDVARIAVSSHYHPVKLEVPQNRRDFKVAYNHIFLQDISISSFQNTSHFRVDSGATETAYILQFLPLNGAASGKYKNEETLVTNCSGALYSPFWPTSNDYFENQSEIVIRIERSAIESCFEYMCGKRAPDPIEFDFKMDLRNPILSGLKRFVNDIVLQLDENNAFMKLPLIQSQLKNILVTGLLSAQRHSATSLLEKPIPNSGPHYVRQAEEYIHEHCGEPITVTHLARYVGVSLRSLQVGFQKHRGYTIQDFIKDERLRLARKHLLHPVGKNVTEIALLCGFNHHSQFSADYQNKYGEKPSETLNRAKLLL